MSLPYENALRASSRVLRVLLVVNMVYAAAIAGLVVFSFVAEDTLLRAFKVSATVDREAMLRGLRLIAMVGIFGAALTQIILKRALGIIDTVRSGDPFISENGERLQSIAWTLLAIQVLHIVVGIIIASTKSAAPELDIDWSFSITPWIAVLLLFVLARVFEHGARMRADLAGTV